MSTQMEALKLKKTHRKKIRSTLTPPVSQIIVFGGVKNGIFAIAQLLNGPDRETSKAAGF